MSEFDVSRIVPSTRDFAGAVRNQWEGLVLVPVLGPDRVADEVKRLDTIGVRAFAVRQGGEACLLAARATDSTPILSLAPAMDVEACQRARFYGADGVALRAELFPLLAKTVQSMRMMPAALVSTPDEARAVTKAGARVVVVRGELESVSTVCEGAEKHVTLIADVIDTDVDALRALAGRADAALVPTHVHMRSHFGSLVDELD